VRIAVIGGGPGGLYFSYLWKKRHPDARIDLFEQNPAGATWGFGVVFSEQALEFLRADDPDTVDAIAPRMESWKNITLNLRGESVEIDGVGFSSIGRLDLLGILQARAASTGAALHFETQASLDQLSGYDLIVAADGLNSTVRRTFEGDFGTSLSYSSNKFAWYGTTKRFETLSQTFVQTDLGSFNAHHYRYSPGMSTFLVECDLATWQAYGFADKTVEESKAICQQVFAKTLDGHGLISNKSVWRNFPWVWNERWFFKNMVLIGDALHSAHFSIGSGTRLAIEDASENSKQSYLAAVTGACAGGGYELALAADHIMLVDDRRSAVSLPETALLAVLPGTGSCCSTTSSSVFGRRKLEISPICNPSRRISIRAARKLLSTSAGMVTFCGPMLSTTCANWPLFKCTPEGGLCRTTVSRPCML